MISTHSYSPSSDLKRTLSLEPNGISWSKFGVFKCYYLVQVGVFKCYYLVQVCFLTYKNSGFKRFGLHTQLSFCVFFLCPIIWQFSKNSLFQKKGAKIGFFNFQCFKYKI